MTDELWAILQPVTWATWGVFALMMVWLAWVVLYRAHLPPGFMTRYATVMRRGQYSSFGVFVLMILLFAWAGSPWQGVQVYARTFLPILLMEVIAHVVLARYAKRGEA